MATKGTENYSRLVLTLLKGGTKVTRKLLEKRISNDTDIRTVDELLQKHEEAILKHPTGRNKKYIFFPKSNGVRANTDLEKWDLGMFCFILLQTCGLTSALRMHVEKLQKLRNKVCHMPNPSIEDYKYEDHLDKIEKCFEKCFNEIQDESFSTEIKQMVDSFKSGPYTDEIIKYMFTFHQQIHSEEFEHQRKMLEKIDEKLDEGKKETDEKLNKVLNKLETLDARLQSKADVPATRLIIEVENCKEDVKKNVIKILVKTFNEVLHQTDASFKDDMSNEAQHTLREVISETFENFLTKQRHITEVVEKCVMLKIKCASVSSFVGLIRDYRSGDLDNQLGGLQSAIQSWAGCEDIVIETSIFEDDFWNSVDTIVDTLEREIETNECTMEPHMSYSGIPGALDEPHRTRINGIGQVNLGPNVQGAPAVNSVRLTVRTSDPSHKRQVGELIETSTFTAGLKRIGNEIGSQMKIEDVTIQAKVLREAEFPKVLDDSANGCPIEEDLKPSDIQEKQIQSNETEALGDSTGSEESVQNSDIDDILQQSFDAFQDSDFDKTRKLAKRAADLVDLKKDEYIKFSCELHDDQICCWYRFCSNIFLELGETEDFKEATKCYYSAMLFDQDCDYDEHLRISDFLWSNVLFLRWFNPAISEDVEPLLEDLDKLAELAERRKQWSVCVTLASDMDVIYYFLSKFWKRTHYTPVDEKLQECWKTVKLRQARCFLNMGIHNDARKVCVKVLQEMSEYDDAEALEIWARSLVGTKDFELALDKCKLAQKYCNEKQKSKLDLLRSDIEQKICVTVKTETKQPDKDWLIGTNVQLCTRNGACSSVNVNKTKKRHKRPQARSPSEQSLPPRVPESTVQTVKAVNTDSGQKQKGRLGKSKERRKYVRRGKKGNNSSKKSVPKSTASDEYSNDDSISIESESSDSAFNDDEVSDVDHSNRNVIFKQGNTDLTFYEQSVQEEKKSKRNIYQKWLESGVELSTSYLEQFEDKHSDVVGRRPFYETFLSELELKKILLKYPTRYVTAVIRFESSHEACCIPVGQKHMKEIQISGRSKIGQVFNEDEVVIELLDDTQKEIRHGKVVGISKRKRFKDVQHPTFLCTLDDMESHLFRPICKTIPKIHVLTRKINKKFQSKKERDYKIEVYNYDESEKEFCNAEVKNLNPADKDKYVFLVAYIHWGKRHIYPRGAILSILPRVNTVSDGLEILNLQYNVPSRYQKAIIDPVEKLSIEIDDHFEVKPLFNRKDFSDRHTFTIGDEGEEDLNYAFSISRIEDGYEVGVHVSDISEWIKKDSLLDQEAMRRGKTFPSVIGRTSHMFPEPLSENRFSLLPGKRRLTISVLVYIANNGKLMQIEGKSNYDIVLSCIKSKRHYTYKEVDGIRSKPTHEEGSVIDEDLKLFFNVSCKMGMKIAKSTDHLFDIADCVTDPSHQLKNVQCTVDKVLLVANEKVTEKLRRSCKDCMPLLYTPKPSKEEIDEFFRDNGQYDIVLKLQNKQVGSTVPDVSKCLEKTNDSVILDRYMWKLIRSQPKDAAKYIEQDCFHPIQLTTFLNWLSFQRNVEYRCSGKLAVDDSARKLFTKFTSPGRSYMDLVVQRLVHASIQPSVKCPYSVDELELLCVDINSTNLRAREFERACRQLKIADSLRDNPIMLKSTVKRVSERELTLCSSLLNQTSTKECELPFSLLDVAVKPKVTKTKTNSECVEIVWKKRLFNCDIGMKEKDPQSSKQFELNPDKDVVFIPFSDWAKMVQLTMEHKSDKLPHAINDAKVCSAEIKNKVNDVSIISFDDVDLRPDIKFSMTYRRNQMIKTQITADLKQGMLSPKLMLYDMTGNIKFCLLHTENPVSCLYHYSTFASCEKYTDVQDYLKRWIPMLLMESATGAVRNEESFCLTNVKVVFTETNRGCFYLGEPECEVRNIEFSGLGNDDEDNEEEQTKSQGAYDWLCLKAPIPTSTENKSHRSDLDTIWVSHASITKVSKQKKGSDYKIKVKFTIVDKNRNIPSIVKNLGNKFSVEVLRKNEVDRRTETFIRALPNEQETLAEKIALNRPIPPLDKSRKDTAQSIEQDLYYDDSEEDIRMRPLPRNNHKQQEAVTKALTSRFTLIQGPPGTGKTNTGIKLIYLFDKINSIQHKEGKSRKQVLFCGPSNKSVDLVAIWMLNRMGNYCPNFVRVYGRSIEAIDFPVPGRTFQSKRSTKSQRASPQLFSVALHHLIRQKGKKHAEEINKMDKMFKDDNYSPKPVQVNKYVHLVREASIDAIRQFDVILCTTAVGSNPKVLQAANVYQVIVDEAGMCPEPHCLVPIIATKAEQVVLIGDHNQLKPIVMCKEAASLGLETSLFERYAKTNLSENVEFIMLEDQYRMDPNLCDFPSKEFYGGKLKTDMTKATLWRGRNPDIWPTMYTFRYPHILIDIEGEEETLTVSTEDGNEQSKSNADEVSHVVNTYMYLLEKLKENQQKPNVQILSQYNAQCSKIKEALKKEGHDGENVSTVVSSQGGEWDYVIFSTVRSLPSYKIEMNPTIGWCQHYLGFITDRNQINVALTRARKGLVIIGNKKLLQCDKVWMKLIQHYEAYGCIMTKEQFPPPGKQHLYRRQQSFKDTSTIYIGSSVRRGRQPIRTNRP